MSIETKAALFAGALTLLLLILGRAAVWLYRRRYPQGLDWCRPFLYWLWPLLAMAGTIFAVWLLWFHRHDSTKHGDAILFAGVGIAYLIAIGFLLIFTRRWTLRGLGQVATYGADSALYLGVGGASLGWWHVFTADELNLIRSSFVVGSTLLVVGLGLFAVQRRRLERSDVD